MSAAVLCLEVTKSPVNTSNKYDTAIIKEGWGYEHELNENLAIDFFLSLSEALF